MDLYNKSVLMLVVSVLTAFCVGCQKQQPVDVARDYWSAYFREDLEAVKQHASAASLATLLTLEDVLPMQQLKAIRVQALETQTLQNNMARSDEPSSVLNTYEESEHYFVFGDARLGQDEILIPTRVFENWNGKVLSWDFHTRLILEPGQWKVDATYAKDQVLAGMESEIRDTMLTQTQMLSTEFQKNIRTRTQALTEELDSSFGKKSR